MSSTRRILAAACELHRTIHAYPLRPQNHLMKQQKRKTRLEAWHRSLNGHDMVHTFDFRRIGEVRLRSTAMLPANGRSKALTLRWWLWHEFHAWLTVRWYCIHVNLHASFLLTHWLLIKGLDLPELLGTASQLLLLSSCILLGRDLFQVARLDRIRCVVLTVSK